MSGQQWTEAEVLAVLRRRYAKPGNGGSGEYAFLTHVRNGAGFDAARTFDAVVVDLYPSRGLSIDVIEVKVSRSDWLRELRQPKKTAAALTVADRFWIAAPTGIVKPEELGVGWGLIEVSGRSARTKVGAQRIEHRAPVDRDGRGLINRGFLVGLLRSAHGAIPGRSTWDAERRRWRPVCADIYPELDPDASIKTLPAAQEAAS